MTIKLTPNDHREGYARVTRGIIAAEDAVFSMVRYDEDDPLGAQTLSRPNTSGKGAPPPPVEYFDPFDSAEEMEGGAKGTGFGKMLGMNDISAKVAIPCPAHWFVLYRDDVSSTEHDLSLNKREIPSGTGSTK